MAHIDGGPPLGEQDRDRTMLEAADLLGGEWDAFLSMIPREMADLLRQAVTRARNGEKVKSPTIDHFVREAFARKFLIDAARPFLALQDATHLGPVLVRLARVHPAILPRVLETNVFRVADRLTPADLEPLLRDPDRRVREEGLTLLAELRGREEAAPAPTRTEGR